MSDSPHRVLIPEKRIAARVRGLGREITRHYRGRRPVLLGALPFLADLVRAVDLDTEIATVRLASYAGTKSTGRVRGLGALRGSFRGRELLVIDDILETGRTLHALCEKLRESGADDVKTCVLLEKGRTHEKPIRADWVGFHIKDEFVIGYGMDYNGRFRGLSDISLFSPPHDASTP